MVVSLSVSVEPFANVNVFVPVNVVRVSIDELNSKSVFLVFSPPEAVKKGTNVAGCRVSPLDDTIAIGLSPAFEPAGSVAPVAAIDIEPVPSELIVAPARSIVSPARNKSFHLFVALPKFLELVVSEQNWFSCFDRCMSVLFFALDFFQSGIIC